MESVDPRLGLVVRLHAGRGRGLSSLQVGERKVDPEMQLLIEYEI